MSKALANPSYTPIPHPSTGRFQTFSQFYPFYLGEHANKVCRRLHLTGTTLSLVLLVLGIAKDRKYLKFMPLVGYAFAWVGHFFFEKNRPATFKYPMWSLMADNKLWWEVLTGKRQF